MTEPNRLHAFKLDQSGLARVFGELEATIMDVLWRRGDGTVADVCADLLEDHNYKTIMTVMNRLVEKGALKRTRRSRAFVYQPSEARAAFEASLSRLVSLGLVRDYGALALAQFVETVNEVDPELLQRLGEMVKERTAAGTDAPPNEHPANEHPAKVHPTNEHPPKVPSTEPTIDTRLTTVGSDRSATVGSNKVGATERTA